jgi:hypothetical protein
MGPKNKKKSKDDDEDWDALLDAEVAKNAATISAEAPKVEAEAVATADQDDDDSDGDEAPGAAKVSWRLLLVWERFCTSLHLTIRLDTDVFKLKLGLGLTHYFPNILFLFFML